MVRVKGALSWDGGLAACGGGPAAKSGGRARWQNVAARKGKGGTKTGRCEWSGPCEGKGMVWRGEDDADVAEWGALCCSLLLLIVLFLAGWQLLLGLLLAVP